MSADHDHDAAPGLDPALATALTQELTRHARLLHAMKASMASLVPEGLDPAAFPLLLTLTRCGPRRQGELAEMLGCSTPRRSAGTSGQCGPARVTWSASPTHPGRPRRANSPPAMWAHCVAHEPSAPRATRRRVVSALASWNPAASPTLVHAAVTPQRRPRRPFRPHPRPGDRPTTTAARSGPHPAPHPCPTPRTPDQENA